MSDLLTLEVEGVPLDGTDAAGNQWKVLNLTGWETGSGVDVRRNLREGQGGEFATAGLQTGRQVRVEFRVRSLTHIASIEAERLVGTVLVGGRFGTITVQHVEDVELFAFVQRLAEPDIVRATPTYFTVAYTLLAPDPFRYGAAVTASTGFASDPVGAGLVEGFFTGDFMDFGPLPTSNGTVTMDNVGNATAYPVFTVSGPTPAGGFTITDVDTGAQVAFLGAIPAGSSLEVDTRTGSALIDGVADRSGDLLVTTWPTVPPSGSATYRFAPASGTSAATLSVELAATYW